jgi:hypothetical protein
MEVEILPKEQVAKEQLERAQLNSDHEEYAGIWRYDIKDRGYKYDGSIWVMHKRRLC